MAQNNNVCSNTAWSTCFCSGPEITVSTVIISYNFNMKWIDHVVKYVFKDCMRQGFAAEVPLQSLHQDRSSPQHWDCQGHRACLSYEHCLGKTHWFYIEMMNQTMQTHGRFQKSESVNGRNPIMWWRDDTKLAADWGPSNMWSHPNLQLYATTVCCRYLKGGCQSHGSSRVMWTEKGWL